MARVLVVDDQAPIREVVRAALLDEGYDVAVAQHGRAALAAAKRFMPDLILLDLMMPVMDGQAFAHEYRRGGGGASIVLMSANPGGAAAAREVEAKGFIEKPFDLELLYRVVSAALESPADEELSA